MHAWQPNRKYRTFIVIDDHSIRQVIVDNTAPLSRGGEVQVESFTRLNIGVIHYRYRSTLHCVSSRWVGETEGQCRSDVVQSTCWEVLYWVQMTVWHIHVWRGWFDVASRYRSTASPPSMHAWLTLSTEIRCLHSGSGFSLSVRPQLHTHRGRTVTLTHIGHNQL